METESDKENGQEWSLRQRQSLGQEQNAGQGAGQEQSPSQEREEGQSFQELATPLIDSLYRYAMKLTNNPEDAQDLVQDTFERGYKHFDSFTQGTNFAAWMTTIERNLFFNQYQKAKRSPKRANDATGEYNDWDIYAASEHQGSGLKSAEQTYADAYPPEEIMDALAKLSPERREVFILAAIDGKSYQEVADELGIKIGTVMSRLNRARTQLKKELQSYAMERGYSRVHLPGRQGSPARPGPGKANKDGEEG
ncbi:sigma-70 family RNA polymerase sigma factor [Parascardovia denticolens]